MITELNHVLESIDASLHEEVDVAQLAASQAMTEYHLRRMFSSLTGMPISEYIRRRRMSAAAADVLGAETFLDIAVRYGYGSAEAFGRAFRAVHGSSPSEVRSHGGPLRMQAKLRLSLKVEGNTVMDARIIDKEEFKLIGHIAKVPLIHEGVNPHIQAHIASLPIAEHGRLKALSETQPAGLLQISADVDPDYIEGSELTYMHGVAVLDAQVPQDLDVIEVPAGTWVVFSVSGPYPQALQEAYAHSASQWFPSNPWQLRPGPSIVAVLERAEDFSSASIELWLPIERD